VEEDLHNMVFGILLLWAGKVIDFQVFFFFSKEPGFTAYHVSNLLHFLEVNGKKCLSLSARD
jgi:hypothetical protein